MAVPQPPQEEGVHGRSVRLFILATIAITATAKAGDTQLKVERPAMQGTQVAPLTYLQLSATRRQSAERMADDLRKKNFEVITAEIDGMPGFYRVLVGPVTANGVLQLRADLERAGFSGKAAMRRTSLSPRAAKEAAIDRPVAGQIYLELSVTSRDSAYPLVDALRQKTFNAMASEIAEEPGMFRVMVRPAEDTGAGIAQIRSSLESAGFPGSIVIRIPAESDSSNPDAAKSLSAGATQSDASDVVVGGQSYLEFSATSPQTAQIIADALREKGFDAIASETEDPPGVFGVQVRPVNDTVDHLRADLEQAGFHGNAFILRVVK